MDQNYQNYSEVGVEELPPAPKKKGPSIILIIVVVLLLLCCCLVVFMALFYFWLGDLITDALGITQFLAPILLSA
jgi:hypothetical protein